jgi:hypothetical protein
MQRYFNTLFFLILYIPLTAQIGYNSEQLELHKLTNNWLNTDNAAGLGFINFHQHGNSELGYSNESGNLHRAQEGDGKNGIRFFSERFDKIDKNWMSWGSFEFRMNTEENRTWSNAFHTYNNSPYLFGDSIPGRYDQQTFDLRAKICRKINEKWSFGVNFDYYAGDMSRLRDGRTRTFIADYAIAPGTVFKINGSNIFGTTLGFRFEKEKMPSVITVQANPEINYFFFLGNENANAVKNAYLGFDRQFVSRELFAELQYNFVNKQLDWFTTLGFTSRQQQVLGGERESPGEFQSQNVRFNSKANVFLNKKLLIIDLKSNYQFGTANEFLQELVITRDTINHDVSKRWNTLYIYKNRYSSNSYNARLNISLRNLLNDGKDYSWMAAIDGTFYGFSNSYQLPYSVFESQRLRFGTNAGVRVLNKKGHRISLTAKGGFGFGLNNKLELNSIANATPNLGSSTFEKATFKIANEIMKPDLEFYKQNVIDYGVDALYSFPLKSKKSNFVGQTKVFYNNQISGTLGSWRMFGFSLGLITL